MKAGRGFAQHVIDLGPAQAAGDVGRRHTLDAQHALEAGRLG